MHTCAREQLTTNLTTFIHGALMVSDTPIECFLDDTLEGPRELAEDVVEFLAPALDRFDLVAHLERQKEFSEKTFGPGARTKGVLDHIRKELAEIEADPADVGEWVDVIILAFDGAWRAGWKAEEIVAAIVAKQAKSEARTWPDWRLADPDKAIEHDRSKDNRIDVV